MVKCGAYWADIDARERVFGPLTLRLVNKIGLPAGVDLMREDATTELRHMVQDGVVGGFEFPSVNALSQEKKKHIRHGHRHRQIATIKRTFELTHSMYPYMGTRRVVQLQYLEWPDMNVPDDARGVLELVREVDAAVEETGGTGEGGDCGETEAVHENAKLKKGGRMAMRMDPKSGIARHALGRMGTRPVLLHCSAGVGRTGGFIAVDAVLDAIRKEIRKNGKAEQQEQEAGGVVEEQVNKEGANAMEVDDDAPIGDAIMTVPIAMSGDKKIESGMGGGKGEKLVVHVPAVVVPVS